LFALPVTSFPFFPPALGGEALVRPLSIYPLLVLLIIAVLPRLFTRPVSRTVITLLPFFIVAAAASGLSLLRGIEPALGISVESRVIRGLITLLIGCAFYVAVAQFPESLDDLRFSLRWLLAGGAVGLAWGSVQALVMLLQRPAWFAALDRVQAFISIRPLRPDRISGLTYEPHWFAEQILLLILPWCLAAVFTNTTVFAWRKGRFTIEAGLLLWALLLLPFTYSRAGLANLLALLALSVLALRPLPAGERPSGWWRSLARRRTLEALLLLVLAGVPGYFIGARNPFFARVWQYWSTPHPTLAGYLTYLGFDARVVYAQAAFNAYQAYPVTGVGLGNYAFYFEEMLPYRPIAEVPEVLYMITPEAGRDRLITSKNLYLRLLAETGIVGAVCFTAFVIAVAGCAVALWIDRRRRVQFWGVGSLCGMLAVFLAALTFDSFVIPNMWVIFGLITAASRVIIASSNNQSDEPILTSFTG
jgi:O-antigen ligase